MMNTISILGSTGSIGRQTLDVAEQLGLQVAALTANSNVERMEAQCRKFRPRLAVMTEEAAAKELAVRLQDTSVKVLAGTDALVDAAVIPDVFHPPGDPDGLADVGFTEFPAGVGAVSGCVHDGFSFADRCAPARALRKRLPAPSA